MEKSTLITKIISWIILLVATIVGAQAHFSSATKKIFEIDLFMTLCKEDPFDECPFYTLTLERVFVYVAIAVLVLTAISIVLEIVLDLSGFKKLDAAFLGLAGVMLIAAGGCMLAATLKLDEYLGLDELDNEINSFCGPVKEGRQSIFPPDFEDVEWVIKFLMDPRKEMKYLNKLAAGSLAIIDACIYFGMAGKVARG